MNGSQLANCVADLLWYAAIGCVTRPSLVMDEVNNTGPVAGENNR